MERVIIMSLDDNVATATSDINKGDKITISQKDSENIEIEIREFIPKGYKFALRNIGKNENVVKYREVIGRATQLIETGEMVHVHNVESLRGRGDLT